MKVAVLGATGSTGSLVVDELLAKGHSVVAVSRRPAPARAFGDALQSITGELTDAGFLAKAIAGCGAVISCLGQNRAGKSLWSKRTSPADILSKVARATVTALGPDSTAHFVYLSAFGVGEVQKHSLLFRLILKSSSISDAYEDHAESERVIKTSRTRWTIVKPPGLTDKDKKVKLVDQGEKWSSFSTATKISVAAFLVECVEDPRTIGKSITIGEAK